jgi:leucyl/phenylalanyl-tRNA---protein transferase
VTNWSTRPEPVAQSRWRFPPVADWPEGDIVAAGGDLEPGTLIAAYRQGLFPMSVEASERILGWWSPNPRGIVPLDQLRVTKSMQQSARRFEIRIDTCFGEVIRACGNPARESGWITDDFIEAYTKMHDMGWAHSVEVFDREGKLAGGLYGVRINGLFAGESMFYVQRDASKVALMALVDQMQRSGMTLLDVQWRTEHLGSLGAIEIGRAEYLALLADALATAVP